MILSRVNCHSVLNKWVKSIAKTRFNETLQLVALEIELSVPYKVTMVNFALFEAISRIIKSKFSKGFNLPIRKIK